MSSIGVLQVKAACIAVPVLLSWSLCLMQCGAAAVSSSKSNDQGEPPALRELLHRGNGLFQSGEYLQAIEIYQKGYKQAKDSGYTRSAIRFLNNLGSAHYELFHYRDAIQAYLAARDLAMAQRDGETLAALCSNLSSLYFQMGELEASRESAEQALTLDGKMTTRFRAKLLIQCARIKRKQKDPRSAVALLQDAIKIASREHDTASEVQALDTLGNTLLREGQLSEAEKALVESLRLRQASHDDHLFYSFESLGTLRKLQGDLQSALGFFDKAVESAQAVSPSATWKAYYARGHVKLAQARLEAAYADFGAALTCARRWRAEVLPADAFRVSSEVELDEVYASFIELGSQLYAQTGRKQFIEETFAAAEESRAASLRALLAGHDLTKALPAQYWEALADLNKLEARLVNCKSDAEATAVRRLKLKLEEMEARAGLDFPADRGKQDGADRGLLERTRRALDPTEVFLGFHLGNQASWLWLVAREGYESRRLPPTAYFAAQVSGLAKAVRENSPEAPALGNRLYTEIFGNKKGLLDKPKWILAPDGPLFEMPFAVLVPAFQSPDGRPLYLVERHAIQFVPGVSSLFHTGGLALSGPIIGVGDPIYNRADPRLRQRISDADAQRRYAEFARLVGSGREIEHCAKIWRSRGYEPILLQGEAANRENLANALRRKTAVLHLSAHVLFPAQDSGAGVIALRLAANGTPEFLSATEIARMRVALDLVVLNGCSSARATILPGAGLMGLTRAWLAAGARAVIATRWATADYNNGELFQSFYSRFSPAPDGSHRRSFAELLQLAQITELRAGGSRADPAKWGAYFCVERN
jgi:CHAT domain-containing protein